MHKNVKKITCLGWLACKMSENVFMDLRRPCMLLRIFSIHGVLLPLPTTENLTNPLLEVPLMRSFLARRCRGHWRGRRRSLGRRRRRWRRRCRSCWPRHRWLSIWSVLSLQWENILVQYIAYTANRISSSHLFPEEIYFITHRKLLCGAYRGFTIATL